MAVTSKDIAERLGLSASTVSRVLRGKGQDFISETTRNLVLETARELGYVPNRFASALSSGQTHTIALLLPQVYGPIFVWIAQCMHETIRREGYGLLTDRVAIGGWQGWPVDGAVSFYIKTIADYKQEHGIAPNVPTVNVDWMEIKGSDTVVIDLYQPAKEMIEHLIASGRIRVGFLTSQDMAIDNEPRLNAYLDVMTEAGLQPEVICCDAYDRESARKMVLSRFSQPAYPDAIVTTNDDLAFGVMRGLRDIGMRIPEDVWVAGCDGIPDGEYLEPRLSTIAIPIEQACVKAWEMLKDRMKNPESPLNVINLDARLVLRESTGDIAGR